MCLYVCVRVLGLRVLRQITAAPLETVRPVGQRTGRDVDTISNIFPAVTDI